MCLHTVKLTPEDIGHNSRIAVLALKAFTTTNNSDNAGQELGYWDQGDANGANNGSCQSSHLVFESTNRENYTFTWTSLSNQEIDFKLVFYLYYKR